jgi:hypothetical protein
METVTFSDLPSPAFTVVIGMINTGKTSIGRKFVQAQPDPTSGVVIHSKEEWDKCYTDLMPIGRVFDNFDTVDEISSIITMILRVEPHPSFVVIDNCLWINSGRLWSRFINLINYCKKHQIPILVTMIYGMGIPQHITDMIDVVIVLHQGIETNIRRIFTYYGLGLESYEQLLTLTRDINAKNRVSDDKHAIVLTRDAHYRIKICSR